jgi:beta-N-acetylhexosaminidase
VLEAAAEFDVEAIILDRPNPLGGEVMGAPFDVRFSSLVGRYPVPTQPGMTLGELAQLFNGLWNPARAQLSVIPCSGYKREMTWAETGLVFVPPSPNMPNLTTVQHYPGACLVEGTSLSEGRGTALPFHVVGAPSLDGYALATTLNRQDWPGVRFRPAVFKPTASKYTGLVCGGVQAHITDTRTYRPLEVWLGTLAIIYQQQPFTWNPHFERLVGTDKMRDLVESHAPLDNVFAEWKTACALFDELRTPYLIY